MTLWLVGEIQNVRGKESDRKSWSTNKMYRYVLKTNVSNDNAWYLERSENLKWIILLCKSAYASRVFTDKHGQRRWQPHHRLRKNTSDQWTLLQKINGMLVWNQMQLLWILSWTQVDKLVWSQKHRYSHGHDNQDSGELEMLGLTQWEMYLY